MWILIDVHNWYAADFYAAGANSPTVFCNRLRDVIAKIKSTSDTPVTRIQLCSDSKESFRRDLDATYKSHRRQKADDYWTNFDRLMTELSTRCIEPMERTGFEADDLIAALCWEAHHEGEKVVICSGDRDLHALLTEGEVTQATKWERINSTTVKPTWVTAAIVFDRYGVHPHQWIDYRCMVGDKSDGLTGCPGIGDETAKIVLQACGTLERFWADPFLPAIQPGKRNRLIAFRKQYESVRQLVALRVDCLSPEAAA
jgi:DNA polymerase I